MPGRRHRAIRSPWLFLFLLLNDLDLALAEPGGLNVGQESGVQIQQTGQTVASDLSPDHAVAVGLAELVPRGELRPREENDLAARRLKLLLRVLYLLFVVAIIYVVTMLPIMLIDLWLKGIWNWIANVPIVPFCLLAVTCFIFIYATTYLYRYYRWLLDYQEN